MHCHYDITSGRWSQCDHITKKRKKELQLKKGQPHKCPRAKTIEEFCTIGMFTKGPSVNDFML